MSEKIDNSYGSQIYYDVVFRNKVYKGWKAIYVGLGRMDFENNRNEIIKTMEKKYGDADWMEQCWKQFLDKLKKGV